ncbi:MAG TPA: T9SS type A sorting domain-containing protein [Bacteroidales bacterium]
MPSRTIIILLAFCLLFLKLSGQEQFYFNERIDHHNNYDRARNVIETDSGYVIAGITEDSLYMYQYHLTLTQISKNGNIKWFKEYGYDSINYFFGYAGSLIQFSQNKFYSSCYKRIYTEDWVHDQGMLVCFNDVFDTILTSYYGEKVAPYDTAFQLFQINKTSDNGLIMTGGRKPDGLPIKTWLIKTDSLGNKLWEKFYGEGEEYFSGYSVIQTTDGGYAIGGFKFTIGDSNSGDPIIIKTDSTGNEEWTLNPGSQYADNVAMLALSPDGNIIAATNFATKPHGDNRDAKTQILKIRNDGEIISNKLFGEPLYDNFLTQIRVKDNGELIATGTYSSFTPTTPSTIGWVLCIDINGNQKWYNEYVNLYGDFSFNELYDIIPTNDNGFLACGRVSPNLPDTGTEDIWVLKLDSLGNDTTTVGIIEKPVFINESMQIFPNPVTEELTVSIETPALTNTFVIIYNLYGLKTEEIEIPLGEKTVQINASNWQSGLYVAVLKEQGKIIARQKFVVQ